MNPCFYWKDSKIRFLGFIHEKKSKKSLDDKDLLTIV